MEIDLELSALHFRVDLRDFQTEFDSLPFEFGVQAGMHFIEVVLVGRRLDFKVGKVVDLPDFLTRADRLSQFDVQLHQFAVDRRLYFQVFHPLADQLHVFVHVLNVFFQVIDLYDTGQRILLLAFDNQFSAALDQLVVFFGLQVFLPGDQLFVVQLFFLLVLPFFSLDVEVGRELLFLLVQPILFHLDLCVPQGVHPVGQLGLAFQYRSAQVLVAQRQDHVSLFDRVALFDVPLFDHAALQRRELQDRDRLHGAVDPDIIVEKVVSGRPDGDRAAVDHQRRRVVAENQPQDEEEQYSSQDVGNMFFLETFFLLELDVHR